MVIVMIIIVAEGGKEIREKREQRVVEHCVSRIPFPDYLERRKK